MIVVHMMNKTLYVYEDSYKYNGIWNKLSKPIYFWSTESSKMWTLKYKIAEFRGLDVKKAASYITVKKDKIKNVKK